MMTKRITKQQGDRIKIRSVSDGKRVGVGPHANKKMRFVFLTALRETRSSWRRLVFFFICMARPER